MKRAHIHLVSVLIWLLAVVSYIYLQNNFYSVGFAILLLCAFAALGFTIHWRSLLKTWLLLSVSFMIFYGLFVHQGDRILFSMPGRIPLISGIISLNSILYGLFLGAGFTLSLYMFSLAAYFSQQRRLTFYLPGVWQNISFLFSFLSHFVSFFFSHYELFQKKMKNRAVQISSMKKLYLFLHDSSFYAMENSFSFAETLEVRGFSIVQDDSRDRLGMVSIFLLLAAFLFFTAFRITHIYSMLFIAVITASLFVWLLKKIKNTSVTASRYEYALSNHDWLLITWSIFFLIVIFTYSRNKMGYLSQQNFMAYFDFDWKIHSMFVLHGFLMFFMHKKAA